ncbi:MAG: restriction endonuclease subunit S [Anaerolineales bacterium]|nr:restriction endonuclease subunit S [Anaerolineales bacterium]
MKKGWTTKKLSEICRFINGRAYNKQELLNTGKYPVLRVGNFFTSDHWYYSDLELEENKYCDNGDLLYAWSASFGPKIWDGGKVIYHYHIWKVIPDESLVTKEFLYHLLDWDKDQIKIDQGAGTTMTHVSKGSMDERLVNIPPLAEQERIVSLLDESFAALAQVHANAGRNLVNTREVFEAVLADVFEDGEDWEEKRLEEVLQKTETVDPTKTPNKKYIYIDVSSVNKENLSIEEVNFIKGKDAPSRARKLVKTNDVLFATVRPTLRRIAIVPEEYDNQICSTGYFVLRGKEFIDNKLIFYFLQTKGFMGKMEKLQKGASYPAVTDGEVRNQIIHFPKSLAEQSAIVQRLDGLAQETRRLEEVYQSKLEDVEELRKSVLKEAFEGLL